MAPEATPPPGTPPPPEINSWTGEPVCRARLDETARNKDFKAMFVDEPDRIHFQVTHQYPPQTKRVYNPDTDQYPGEQLAPLDGELTEIVSITRPYMWVGMMCGDDPKKHKHKASGKRAKPSERPMSRDEIIMPVVVACEEDIPDNCYFFVLCDSVAKDNTKIRFAVPISFDQSSIFIFEEFLSHPQEITPSLKADIAEKNIKENIKYHVSRTKQVKGGKGVEKAVNMLQKNLEKNPLVTTNTEHDLAMLNLIGNQLFTTKDERYLDRVLDMLNYVAPGVTTFGPLTCDDGLQAFLDFEDEGFDAECGNKLIAELKAAHPHMPNMSSEFVERVWSILQQDDTLHPQLFSSGLPFFLEECLANWPAAHMAIEASEAEIGVVKKALCTMRRHVRYSNTLTMTDERQEVPKVGDKPDLVGVISSLLGMLQERQKYDDQAMAALTSQFGGMLQHHDIASLMTHLSRVVDVDTCGVLQHQLGVLQAYMYSLTTRAVPRELDSKIVEVVGQLLEVVKKLD